MSDNKQNPDDIKNNIEAEAYQLMVDTCLKLAEHETGAIQETATEAINLFNLGFDMHGAIMYSKAFCLLHSKLKAEIILAISALITATEDDKEKQKLCNMLRQEMLNLGIKDIENHFFFLSSQKNQALNNLQEYQIKLLTSMNDYNQAFGEEQTKKNNALQNAFVKLNKPQITTKRAAEIIGQCFRKGTHCAGFKNYPFYGRVGEDGKTIGLRSIQQWEKGTVKSPSWYPGLAINETDFELHIGVEVEKIRISAANKERITHPIKYIEGKN